MLNVHSPIPLYQQLAERLAAAIRHGDYAVDTRIPSENELASRYRIGRPTVRQATELLVRQGLLARRRGAGTFVRREPEELDAFPLGGTLATFRDRGVPVTATVMAAPRLVDVDVSAEHPMAGRRACFMSRLSRTSAGPALFEETWLDPEVFAGVEGLVVGAGSLAALLRDRYGLEPSGGRQQIRVVAANGERARALQLVDGTAVLQLRRHLDFPCGSDAIYTELYCNTDRIVLTQHIGGH